MASPRRIRARRAIERIRGEARVALARRSDERIRGVVARLADVMPVDVVHDARDVPRSPARRAAGPAHESLDGPSPHPQPAAFRAVLAGGGVTGLDGIALTGELDAVAESVFDPAQLSGHPALRRRLPVPTRRRGRAMLLVNRWATSHAHFVLDTLPRLALLPLTAEPDVPVVVPDGLSAGQRATLARLGVGAERQIPFDGRRLQADELLFPSLPGDVGNPSDWVARWLREQLAPGPAARGRRLYVTREDATWRRVTNEDEVVALLREHGFERIALTELAFEEQLRAFGEAEAIAGAHGAGLTNLVAAAPGTTVIELFDPRYVNLCYHALSSALDLDYWYLIGDPRGRHDLAVGAAELRATLAACGLG